MSKIPSTTAQDSSRLMQALYALNEEAHKNGTAGMSEEEIEAEIKAARAERNGATRWRKFLIPASGLWHRSRRRLLTHKSDALNMFIPFYMDEINSSAFDMQ